MAVYAEYSIVAHSRPECFLDSEAFASLFFVYILSDYQQKKPQQYYIPHE